MKDLSVSQLEDLNKFAQNEGTEIGEIVENLLALYSKQPYISEDLFEKVIGELQEWYRFYQENTEWATWEETVTFTELQIKE